MKRFEDVNIKVYDNLEQILQKLDERLIPKLYAFILDDTNELVQTVRIKSVLSDLNQGQDSETIQEDIDNPKEVFQKLDLRNAEQELDDVTFLSELDTTKLVTYINQETETNINQNQHDIEFDEKDTTKQITSEWNILYENSFKLKENEKQYTIKYILSIEYVDSKARLLYLEKPQISFLRMILDYYFQDYYNVSDHKELEFNNANLELQVKYKENSSQFLQRMARLFLGKIQSLIDQDLTRHDITNADIELTEIERNQYYINNLLEKIDGISTRTYEGENPFGCMLLLNHKMLNDSKLVNYSIRFQDQQPIYLEDARRIRKLLELTNNERELYLIADDTAIYGVGEIDWSQLRERLLFKVEFKGLSRYDLLLVTTEEKQPTDSRIVTEVEAKMFKMTMNLEIVSHKLTSISFKHPSIGSSGFTSELFDRTMKAQFNKDGKLFVKNEAIEKLRLVIQKATEQQSGTMVVITDPNTAVSEMKKLRKQSTPIQPKEINPAFIKQLTSIDGAIYFDTTGDCHAVGVILDGLAQAHLGDASRGARFHSAYRYLEKLKLEESKCVIAIISEDGMVNLIPQQANEAVVRQLIRDMIGYIEDVEEFSEDAFLSYENQLKDLEKETIIDHHHYFKVAETFFKNSCFIEAATYYEKGLETSERFILKYNRELVHSYLLQGLNSEKFSDESLQAYKNSLVQSEIIFNKIADNELIHHDYNRRAIAKVSIGRSIDEEEEKLELFNSAVEDYTKAIEMKKDNAHIIYRNRAYVYCEIGNFTEAIDDFMSSEINKSEEKTIAIINELIQAKPYLLDHTVLSYALMKNEKQYSTRLEELLEEYIAKETEGQTREALEAASAKERFTDEESEED